MTHTREEDAELAIRAGCTASDMHLTCSYPTCTCKNIPRAVKAALASLPPDDGLERIRLALIKAGCTCGDGTYLNCNMEDVLKVLRSQPPQARAAMPSDDMFCCGGCGAYDDTGAFAAYCERPDCPYLAERMKP